MALAASFGLRAQQAPAPVATPPPATPSSPAATAAADPALAGPPLPAQAGRQGSYNVTFGAQRSPWSGFDAVRERGGIARATILDHDPRALAYDLAAETFEVAVPDGEPPAAGWGLVVWTTPTPYGGGLRPQTRRLLAERRLVWVSHNRPGEQERSVWDRWGLALDAAWHVGRLYRLDPARTYVAGYSSGGRVASGLALLWPDVFRGGLWMMGCDWYRDLPRPDRPGAIWPAYFSPPPRALHKLAREESRFVLLTAEHDVNRLQTRVIEEGLRKEDFRHVTYLEVPGVGHLGPVPPEWMAKAFAALDGEAAEASAPTP